MGPYGVFTKSAFIIKYCLREQHVFVKAPANCGYLCEFIAGSFLKNGQYVNVISWILFLVKYIAIHVTIPDIWRILYQNIRTFVRKPFVIKLNLVNGQRQLE